MTSYLFVHQNFPGQFLHVSKALAQRGDKVVAIGEKKRLQQKASPHPAIVRVGYPEPKGAGPATHHYLKAFEAQVRRGQEVFKVAQQLRKKGFVPDVVVAHPGWGEGLFLRDIFPRARHIHYLEFFYRADGADVGFDPDFPATLDDRCRVRLKSAAQMVGFESADAGISPTAWQKSLYPPDWQPRIAQIHDGIDTSAVAPNEDVAFALGQPQSDKAGKAGRRDAASSSGPRILTRKDEVLTYVARNLEPYRGFHTFMRAIPHILERRPNVQILIVGGDDVSYGRLPGKETYRELYQQQWGTDVDRSRVHFLGQLPYESYLKVLQLSSLHLYLTYPFVLSWSMLEAMSAGCLLLASSTAPVLEVIRDSHNGFLTDFFDEHVLAEKASSLLAQRFDFEYVRKAARECVFESYDLHGKCLPRMLSFLAKRVA